MSEANNTDSVYNAHKARIESARVYGPGIIEQMKDYALTKMSRDDSSTMNCGTSKHIEILCRHISACEGIKYTRVYPALRLMGYNHRYHKLKDGHSDILYDISNAVHKCYVLDNPFIIDYVSNDTIVFGGMRSVKYRIEDRDIGIATTDAYNCGINVSELNMYNVLTGINILVSTEPYYIGINNTAIIRPIIKTIENIDDMLQDRLDAINTVLPKQ